MTGLSEDEDTGERAWPLPWPRFAASGHSAEARPAVRCRGDGMGSARPFQRCEEKVFSPVVGEWEQLWWGGTPQET